MRRQSYDITLTVPPTASLAVGEEDVERAMAQQTLDDIGGELLEGSGFEDQISDEERITVHKQRR